MIVLAKYVEPHNGMGYPDVRPPVGDVRFIPSIMNWRTGGGQQLQGAEPLSGPIAQDVLTLLEQIAGNRDTEPRSVWYAAAVLAKRVQSDIEAGVAQ